MTRIATLLTLLAAAILEAGGDALIRRGLDRPSFGARLPLFLGGALLLFAYGLAVNFPRWNFGRLIGLYVVFFFVVAQCMSWVALKQPPPVSTLAGGALIVAGGIVIAFAQA